jgi:23S rRNA pseudouridine2605 synthase
LAEAGVASRRAAERLILQGRVAINGRTIKTLGSQLDPESDAVTVDGKPVRPRRKLYLALNKPPDVVCTRRDEHGRQTVLDLLPREWSKTLYPVGRLDRDTEGLLLLTNDGDFCLRVSHPRYQVPKLYLATVRGRVPDSAARALTKGQLCDGEKLRARRARVVTANNSRSVLELELTEGKNREVRRLLQALELTVERLLRVQVGPVRLGELPQGKWRTLSSAEIHSTSSIYDNAPALVSACSGVGACLPASGRTDRDRHWEPSECARESNP